jgi:hypothetical protein
MMKTRRKKRSECKIKCASPIHYMMDLESTGKEIRNKRL